MPSISEAIIRPPAPQVTGEAALPDFANASIGIFDFEGDPKGGPLVSNNLWQKLLPYTSRLKIVDRSQITKVMDELRRQNSDWVNLSDQEKTERLGKLVQADYFLFGSLSEYRSGEQPVQVTEVFKTGERERYEKEHREFSDEISRIQAELKAKLNGSAAVLNQTPLIQEDLRRAEELAARAKTVEQLEGELRTQTRTETVTALGIVARVVKVSTSQTVWAYNASTRDISWEGANGAVVNSLLKSLFAQTPAAK